MVQALVVIDQNTNRVLNVVKAKYELKDKGAAIDFVVEKYVEELEEPELRPEFVKKIKRMEKQKGIPIKDFAKRFGLK